MHASKQRSHRVIAIDGPAASGKSSVAQELARRLGFVYVNSGLPDGRQRGERERRPAHQYRPARGRQRVSRRAWSTQGHPASWVGNNITDDLRAKGFNAGSSIGHAYETDGTLGRPILRDRLWFFGSYRQFGESLLPADVYDDSATFGSDELALANQTLPVRPEEPQPVAQDRPARAVGLVGVPNRRTGVETLGTQVIGDVVAHPRCGMALEIQPAAIHVAALARDDIDAQAGARVLPLPPVW